MRPPFSLARVGFEDILRILRQLKKGASVADDERVVHGMAFEVMAIKFAWSRAKGRRCSSAGPRIDFILNTDLWEDV